MTMVRVNASTLDKLPEILHPFAADRLQGVDARISRVVPTVVALHKRLSELHENVKHHTARVRDLLRSLEMCFNGLMTEMKLLPGINQSSDSYGSKMYQYSINAVLDLEAGFLWLTHDQPDSQEVKNELTKTLIGTEYRNKRYLLQHFTFNSLHVHKCNNWVSFVYCAVQTLNIFGTVITLQ